MLVRLEYFTNYLLVIFLPILVIHVFSFILPEFDFLRPQALIFPTKKFPFSIFGFKLIFHDLTSFFLRPYPFCFEYLVYN
mmetsp:Transcript_20526/g.31367  ORF Transcript_20526/g.31367 Transcript_20526/m.31367 type:complete len:80 (-) Transcript_20526:100-339(-)